MRKHYFFTLVLGGVLLFCQSCSKESVQTEMARQSNPEWVSTVNVKLAPNELYKLPIDNSSAIAITKQASHYSMSQIAADTKSSGLVYSYLPALNYSGADEVMITVTSKVASVGSPRCGNGNSSSSSSSSTLIKLQVGN
ncbi:MAG: hypothetical protein ABIR81_00430 [Ginsengibacter sp.]